MYNINEYSIDALFLKSNSVVDWSCVGYAQNSIVKSPVPNPKSAVVEIDALSPTPSKSKLDCPNFLTDVSSFASPLAVICLPVVSGGIANPVDFPSIIILSPSTDSTVPDAS